MFAFNEAVSLVVHCRDQAEIDYYWDALPAGGGQAGRCGWLKDRFGLSWQVVPAEIARLVQSAAAMKALMGMTEVGCGGAGGSGGRRLKSRKTGWNVGIETGWHMVVKMKRVCAVVLLAGMAELPGVERRAEVSRGLCVLES